MEGIYIATICVLFSQFFIGFVFYITTMFLESKDIDESQLNEISRAIDRFESSSSIDEMERIFKYFSVAYQVVSIVAFAIIMAASRYGLAMDIFGLIFLILAAIQVVFAIVIFIKKMGFNNYYPVKGKRPLKVRNMIGIYYIRHFVGIGLSPVLLFQRI